MTQTSIRSPNKLPEKTPIVPWWKTTPVVIGSYVFTGMLAFGSFIRMTCIQASFTAAHLPMLAGFSSIMYACLGFAALSFAIVAVKLAQLSKC